jgi:acyl dehydratase
MTFDHARLLNHDIPVVEQEITRRDCAFYALSIGFGQDPLNAEELHFADFTRADRVVPSMATVIGHPGFWLSDPELGVDTTRLVHGEQSFDLLRPLPVEGRFLCRTRVVDVIDKGARTGALVVSEKTVADRQGTVYARARGTTVLRGNGGFGAGEGGGEASVAPVAPQTPPDHVLDMATRPEQALFYGQNADPNPLHLDPDVARQAGFERPILHGLCTFGTIAHALLRSCCAYRPERLVAMSLRFSAPVLPGETIRVEVWRDGAFSASVVERGVQVASRGQFRIA